MVDEQKSPPSLKEQFDSLLTKKARRLFLISHCIAVLFWMYAVTQVFLLDIDALLSSQNAILHTLFKYKFFFLIGTVAAVWLFVKTSTIILASAYVAFYPIILICWKIPKLLWKTNNIKVTFALVNVLASFFKSTKYTFVITSFFLIFSALIYFGTNYYLIIVAVISLPMLLAIIYVHRFVIILRPSYLYQIHSKFVGKILLATRDKGRLDDTVKLISRDDLSEDQLVKWRDNLQTLVIANRACYFLSSKLREYQQSNFKIIFYIGNLFFLIVLTAFVFAITNFGLYKINSEYFQAVSTPDFFIFVYYSVSNVFAQSIPELTPSVFITRLFKILQIFFSFSLLGIIVTLVFSLQSQKETDQINQVVADIKEHGDEMEIFIKDEYQLTVDQAIVELERAKGIFINLIYYLTKST